MKKTKKHSKEWYWTEKQFQTAFKSFLKDNNILNYKTYGGIFKTDNGSYCADNGWSDMIIVENGEVLFIELKRRTGDLRPSQIVWFNEMTKNNISNDNLFVFRATDFAKPEFMNYFNSTKSLKHALKVSANTFNKEVEDRKINVQQAYKDIENEEIAKFKRKKIRKGKDMEYRLIILHHNKDFAQRKAEKLTFNTKAEALKEMNQYLNNGYQVALYEVHPLKVETIFDNIESGDC